MTYSRKFDFKQVFYKKISTKISFRYSLSFEQYITSTVANQIIEFATVLLIQIRSAIPRISS